MNNMNILHCAGSVVVYQVKLKPACPATGTSYKSEISGLASLAIKLSKERITNALIRLGFCEAVLLISFPHPTSSCFLACGLIFINMLPRS